MPRSGEEVQVRSYFSGVPRPVRKAVPVTALPEFLANYRLHGVKLFHIGEDKYAGDRIKHFLTVRAVLSPSVSRAQRLRFGPTESAGVLKAIDESSGSGWPR